MVQAAGLTMFRFPGGSSSDDFHFNAPPTYNGEGTDASMASFIASVNGVGLATLDYGSGSPQEAAAFLAYLERPWATRPRSATARSGTTRRMPGRPSTGRRPATGPACARPPRWRRTTASTSCGSTTLRPFNVQYWEVGNEEYGSWEIDHHTAQHDPATYIAFAKQFATYAAQIDPGISIGLDVGSPGSDFNNWTADILQQSVAQGFMPGFLSDHNYVQAPGARATRTSCSTRPPAPTAIPPTRAIRTTGPSARPTTRACSPQYLGAAGKNVQLLATEFNSVYSNPGKQTTSLVNGLLAGRLAGRLARDAVRRRRRLGPAEFV